MNEAAHQIFRRGHIPIIGVNLALPIIDEVERIRARGGQVLRSIEDLPTVGDDR